MPDLRLSRPDTLACRVKRKQSIDRARSARAGSPSLLVLGENKIPAVYWLPQPPKLDRHALLGDLKHGGVIPGAELSNPKPVLSVRTK